jgi:hypothetical protein
VDADGFDGLLPHLFISSIPAPMASNLNALRWAGQPGHYEVYYVSLTDRGSGWGLWIRYTMVALPTVGRRPLRCG